MQYEPFAGTAQIVISAMGTDAIPLDGTRKIGTTPKLIATIDKSEFGGIAMKLVGKDWWIAMMHFPDRKLPHICYGSTHDNVCHDCGRFNSEERANAFMRTLCEMLGLETEGYTEEIEYEVET